jgi:hypothetical protein
MNTRRGFLATIVAAIFGRKLAKQEYVTPWMEMPLSSSKTITLLEVYAEGKTVPLYFVMNQDKTKITLLPQDGTPLYWHERRPFVTINPAPLPWEKQPPV